MKCYNCASLYPGEPVAKFCYSCDNKMHENIAASHTKEVIPYSEMFQAKSTGQPVAMQEPVIQNQQLSSAKQQQQNKCLEQQPQPSYTSSYTNKFSMTQQNPKYQFNKVPSSGIGAQFQPPQQQQQQLSGNKFSYQPKYERNAPQQQVQQPPSYTKPPMEKQFDLSSTSNRMQSLMSKYSEKKDSSQKQPSNNPIQSISNTQFRPTFSNSMQKKEPESSGLLSNKILESSQRKNEMIQKLQDLNEKLIPQQNEKRVTASRGDQERFGQENKQLQDQLSLIEKSIVEFQNQIQQLNEKSNQLIVQSTQMKQESDELEANKQKQLQEFKNKIKELESQTKMLNQQYQEEESNGVKQINQLEEKIQTYEKELESQKEKIFQEFQEELYQQIQQQMQEQMQEELQNILSEHLEKAEIIEKQYEEEVSKNKELNEKIENFEENQNKEIEEIQQNFQNIILQYEDTMKNLENRIEEQNKTISELQNKKSDISTKNESITDSQICLLYTSPSPRDRQKSRMPSSA
eukprot:TRINITY_DN36692_c0_g1_i1.p1 TRINITY_DN36692_c0_g1~~TRINITY_DN36692_c0_g1_i1.p1  ORF type:complete len:518 (+),score=107.51 TRINITY_DN36692_c0_g1_i1:237-1790(+)